MKKRPWIPIAVVLCLLLGATLAIGSVLRTRLADAEVALEPFLAPELASMTSGEDLPVEPCRNSAEVSASIQGFYEAIEAEASPAEITRTDATFDSFLLESAIARLVSDKHQLLLRARPGSDGWCLDEVEFETEE